MDLLDDPETYRRLDPQGCAQAIRNLPEQCEDAWRAAAGLQLPPSYVGVDKVVVAGMGASAIGGDFLGVLTAAEGRLSVVTSRGYDLPRWVDGSTLVICSSHSGATEETLSAFQQARAAGAKLLAITTGGRLRELAAEAGVPALTYTFDLASPRAAFGHGLMRLLAVAGAVGAIALEERRLADAIEAMRSLRRGIDLDVPERDNAAKQVARRLHGRLPYVVGGGLLAPAAFRWQTQLNENAKTWAFCGELPEMNHNVIVGLGLPAAAQPLLHVLFLDAACLHPRVRLRFDATAELLRNAGISHERLSLPQTDPLAALLCAVHFGDLVSLYLAMLNGVDPFGVANIDWLKARLARE